MPQSSATIAAIAGFRAGVTRLADQDWLRFDFFPAGSELITQGRNAGGSLMVLAHLVFVGHFLAMALRFGPKRTGAALFAPRQDRELAYAQ